MALVKKGIVDGVLLLVALAAILATAQAAEQSASIRVVMDDNYPPYTFRGEDGKLQGILVDQWELWQQKTGIKVDYQGMVWFMAQKKMESGEFDVIDTIFLTEKRAKTMAFSKPYVTLEVPIFFNQKLGAISNPEALRPYAVGVKRGDAAVDLLKEKGFTNAVEFRSYEEIISAAAAEKIEAFVMDKPPALYYLDLHGLRDQFRMLPPLTHGQFHRAVKKGREELLKTVEDGFTRISAREYQRIERRWTNVRLLKPVYFYYVGVGLSLALAMVVGLLVWNRTLRQAVRIQTARLEQEVVLSRERELALQESEEKFLRFMEQFPGLVFIKDGSLRTVMLSKMFETFLGRPLSEMLGKTNNDLFPAEAAEKFNRDDRAALALAHGEHLVVEEPYGDHTYLTYKFPVTHKGQKMIGGFTLDITERKQGEAQRRKLEAQMQHTQKLESLGVLAGGIAHDFNNILTAILGNIDLARSDLPSSHPSRESLGEAAKASRRAAELCRQMLAYAGKGRFVSEVLDLNQLLRDMVHMIEVSISKSVSLQWNLAASLPPVSADPSQLRQVVMNLLINASEAFSGQKGLITLATGALDCTRADLADQWLHDPLPEGRYIFFEVADTGCGMDQQTLARIFDPFFSTKFTGRGLGLAAVLGIVHAHRGAIKVHSESGRGTTFRVFLPAASGSPTLTRDAAETTPGWRASGTVLLVDDEEGIRVLARRMLERFGFHVLTAANGVEALEVFRANSEKVTVVLLDLTMPQMDGETTLRELLRLRHDVRVVLSSGYDENDVTQRLGGQGMAGFVQKPYTKENLAAVLKQVVGDSRSGQNQTPC